MLLIRLWCLHMRMQESRLQSWCSDIYICAAAVYPSMFWSTRIIQSYHQSVSEKEVSAIASWSSIQARYAHDTQFLTTGLKNTWIPIDTKSTGRLTLPNAHKTNLIYNFICVCVCVCVCLCVCLCACVCVCKSLVCRYLCTDCHQTSHTH